jgi:AcrR family transcriptional regulator
VLRIERRRRRPSHDIVRCAACEGTFYLYFETRDDIVTAVAERLVDGVGRQMDKRSGRGDQSGRLSRDRRRHGDRGSDSFELEPEALHRRTRVTTAPASSSAAQPSVSRSSRTGSPTASCAQDPPGKRFVAMLSSLHDLVAILRTCRAPSIATFRPPRPRP